MDAISMTPFRAGYLKLRTRAAKVSHEVVAIDWRFFAAASFATPRDGVRATIARFWRLLLASSPRILGPFAVGAAMKGLIYNESLFFLRVPWKFDPGFAWYRERADSGL
ncbi:MAG: hypothetical protein WAK41_21475 [Roseiarcus sp.]|uniref:hypothetical protein n=1 Tax=Roseiarcus sp. TaxID=1969460 RepID=UPI003BB06B6F